MSGEATEGPIALGLNMHDSPPFLLLHLPPYLPLSYIRPPSHPVHSLSPFPTPKDHDAAMPGLNQHDSTEMVRGGRGKEKQE